jgi:hypothetical protein
LPSRRRIAHQTYQGRNPDSESDSDEKLSKPGRKGTCPYKGPPSNGDHDFDQCSYINPLVRPNNWKPNKKAQQAFKERCELSPRFKTAYDYAIKKHQKSDESEESDELLTEELTDELTDSTKSASRNVFAVYIPKEQVKDIFRDDDGKAMSTIWIPAKKNDT